MKFKAILLIISIFFISSCAEKESVSNNSVGYDSLNFSEAQKLSYAVQFSVKKADCYHLIMIGEKEKFLLVPEDAEPPSQIPDDITVLKQPLNKTYLVSTGAMDFIAAIGAMDNLRFSGAKEKDWYIEEAVSAMKSGNLLYAGKYSAPDFELLVSENCNFAVENTMIYHKPEVKEKLEDLAIPVLVDYSSMEKHPLGRLEWIKLYGLLFNREKEAAAFYEKKLKSIKKVLKDKERNVKIAFFHVTSSGAVNVRTPEDYITKMIKLSGGQYALDDLLKNEKKSSAMNIQMEDFYMAAVDADIIIYNSTIDGKLPDIEALISKNAMFADFKAVKNGRVYCTEANFFQKTTELAAFMVDLNKIISNDDSELSFLDKLE